MPKIKQVRKYLRNHGWVLFKNTDHEHYRLMLADGTYIYTKLSHGYGDIPANIWTQMKKQMRITQEEFNAGI